MKHNMTLKIRIRGEIYTVEGIYYPDWPGTYWQPPEASEFEIVSVKDSKGVERPDMFEDENDYITLIEAADDQYAAEQHEYYKQLANEKEENNEIV